MLEGQWYQQPPFTIKEVLSTGIMVGQQDFGAIQMFNQAYTNTHPLLMELSQAGRDQVAKRAPLNSSVPIQHGATGIVGGSL